MGADSAPRDADDRWDTVTAARRVLVVTRTAASTNRLLDVLPLLSGDTRIETFFTVDGASAFSTGLADRLRMLGARVIDWQDAVTRSFDLALAASDNSDVHRLSAPTMLLPHGVGYHRISSADGGSISGLGPKLLSAGRPVPEVLVVAHPRQQDVVRRLAPSLASRVLVAGDPCLDRMLLSQGRAARYRRSLHARRQRTVVLCSTWGPESLFGTRRELITQLIGELAHDEYRVVLVLHPNVWVRHGALQLRSWLRPALEAGLVLVPPEDGWRAAIVAADVVVSDHGSLTCYALGADKPVLMATGGGKEVVPGSPMDTLRTRLPQLTDGEPLADQLGRAQGPDHDALRQALAGEIFARHGRSARILRTAMYRILELPEPPWSARLDPLPPPAVDRQQPTAFAVYTSPVRHGSVAMTRFPAVLDTADRAGSRHLCALDAESDPGLVERAAVVVGAEPGPARLLARFPGARVAVAATGPNHVVLRLRDGREFGASGTGEPAVIGSAVYACLVAGHQLDDGTQVEVQLGAQRVRITLVGHSGG